MFITLWSSIACYEFNNLGIHCYRKKLETTSPLPIRFNFSKVRFKSEALLSTAVSWHISFASWLYHPIQNKPQRIYNGEQYGTSPKTGLSCLMAESFHGKPCPERSAAKEQKQEEIFRYPTPIPSSPRPSLTLDSTAVDFVGNASKAPSEEFVEPVYWSNYYVPMDKDFPVRKHGDIWSHLVDLWNSTSGLSVISDGKIRVRWELWIETRNEENWRRGSVYFDWH